MNPSHLPKYAQLTKQDPSLIEESVYFCNIALSLHNQLLKAKSQFTVDSEIICDLLIFVKEAITAILINISNIDDLIATLPTNSSPTTPLVSEDDIQMEDSLKFLRSECEAFMIEGWGVLVDSTLNLTDSHKSSFQTHILDDLSFPDLILNSLQLQHQEITRMTIRAIVNIIFNFPNMTDTFISINLVGRMFESVDYVSLPLSESKTLFFLTKFITFMFDPIGEGEETRFKQYPLIRVSALEPAKPFVRFMFNNSDKLILDDANTANLENCLCWIHRHIRNMELRSDEHEADIVSKLVKWEIRTLFEMENQEHFLFVFESMLNRTHRWNRDKRERQKRREVLLREGGWDDAFELRVVGIEVDTNQKMVDFAEDFRTELTLNADEL
ncbi:hypothetical protein BLNAU_8685 [Blattamonas nauphoetae]|uniref:Uncharacterized protein n=1 Tax=Blattamonas nauphoetae TaxID=2049346 RepID=A0ABQ9XXX1_9EUKA|nr:hypothetical protein BLNAU_8685 [Blattamonas nauphoetae]